MIDLLWQASLPQLPDRGIFPRNFGYKSNKIR